MRTSFAFWCLGLVAAFCPISAEGAISQPRSLVGKFLVSSVNGSATCISDGRVVPLKPGQSFPGRGSIVETGPKSNVILVFSNGTGVYTDQNTRFEVAKFDQEFFAPNNNLRVEPSNSWTVVKLSHGRVIVSTPRLQAGTSMFYETPHAAVGIKGDRILIEGNEKQTHIALISGSATINPRDADGRFASLGRRLVTGQEAFVKYTLQPASDEAGKAKAPVTESGDRQPAPDSSGSTAAAPENPVTSETQPTLVRSVGAASVRLPGTSADIAATEGMPLPQGTVLSTAATGEAYVQLFTGVVAVLRPNSAVELSSAAVTREHGKVQKQSVLLDLQSGTVVGTIDPSRPGLNEVSVRTPQGVAAAQGTSFFVRAGGDGLQVGTTADTVLFVTRSGTRYEITAGNVSVTNADGQASAPIPLASAVAADAQLAAVLDGAFEAVATLVQHNLGALPATSAASLLARVAYVTTAAQPAKATAIVARAVAAVTAPTAATTPNVGAATAAVTQAVVSAAPAQAAPIAVAALAEAQANDLTVGAAAARGSPAQSAPITGAVAHALLESGLGAAGMTQGQTAGAIAAAVAKSVPSQANRIATAALQAVLQADPQAAPTAQAQTAGVIGAAITAAAPDQAVPVASALMHLLLQSMAEATPAAVVRSGSVLAGAIIAVVPNQTQEVTTAVMQLMVHSFPNVTPAWVFDSACLTAATLCQAFPPQSPAVLAGIAAATGISVADLEASLGRNSDRVADSLQQIRLVGELAGSSYERGSEAANFADSGSAIAGLPMFTGFGGATVNRGGTTMTIGNNADRGTSIVITQFDPELVTQLTADIEAAQNAQITVQFSTETTAGGTTIVVPEPVVPRDLPSDLVVSPAR